MIAVAWADIIVQVAGRALRLIVCILFGYALGRSIMRWR
jgi:hypothetical protein